MHLATFTAGSIREGELGPSVLVGKTTAIIFCGRHQRDGPRLDDQAACPQNWRAMLFRVTITREATAQLLGFEARERRLIGDSIDTKVIPLSDLQADPEGVLRRCYDAGQILVVELPDRGLISIRPLDDDDDTVDQLIEHNPAFREVLARSIASPREPFPFGEL
jgi:hypothetical protein